MGGSSSTTTTKIPKEIRERGSKITEGAMSNYWDPGSGEKKYNYADYAQQGQDRTGQLNQFNSATGQSAQGVTAAQTSFQPYMTEAADTTRGAFAKTSGAGYVGAISDYMNPYREQVIDATTARMNHNQLVDETRLKDNVGKSGAFGNDRRAILEAELAGQYDLNRNDTISKLYDQNYQQAQGQANTAFTQGLATSDSLAKLGTTTQEAQLKGAAAAQQQGNLLTAQEQAEKDAANAAYMEPLDIYERLAGVNAMQPTNRTSTTTQSGGWLGPALGAAGSALSFFSDETLKEDIKNADPEAVLGAFAKVAPKTYRYTEEAREQFPGATADGERTGFMAQDYQEAFGEDVREQDGYKVMDVPNVIGKLVTAVHGLEKRTRNLKKAS